MLPRTSACLLVLGVLCVASPGRAEDAATPPQTLGSAADETLREVSALRGLRARSPVAHGVLTREQIGDKLRARVDEEYTPAEVLAETRVLQRMGLLPAGTDYKKLLMDLLMEQVQGFYDPKSKRLYIADWVPLDLQRPTMAHELEHALQDQAFGLLALTRPLKDDGDLQLAHSALVEGDASAVMLELSAQAMRVPPEQIPDLVAALGDRMRAGTGTTPLLDRAPRFVRETLLFPYLEGLRFVTALHRDKPWKRVDQAFKAPPASTEQILHPDRYLSGDAPVAIAAAPISALAPRKMIRSDVLGELGLRILFRSRLPEPEADAAAAGWGGDRLVAYAAEGAPVVLDLSTWDTELDAQEAAAAFIALFGKMTGAAGTGGRFVDPNGESWRVERHGDSVLVEMGGPAGDAAFTEAWEKLRVVSAAR